MTTSAAATASPARTGHHVPLSIRILRRLRPVVLALLGSPLHRLLSNDVLIVEWTGRRTGRRYALPISYTRIGSRHYLCTRDSSWWRHLRDAAAVGIIVRGERRAVAATILDATSPEALDALRTFLTKNPGTGRLLYNVATGADGKPQERDLEREVLNSVVVRLE